MWVVHFGFWQFSWKIHNRTTILSIYSRNCMFTCVSINIYFLGSDIFTTGFFTRTAFKFSNVTCYPFVLIIPSLFFLKQQMVLSIRSIVLHIVCKNLLVLKQIPILFLFSGNQLLIYSQLTINLVICLHSILNIPKIIFF